MSTVVIGTPDAQVNVTVDEPIIKVSLVGSAGGGSGVDMAAADVRYLNATGDDMSGMLGYLDNASKLRAQTGSISGDYWFMVNARWDETTKNFYRIDKTHAAFGLQMQATGLIPGEPDLGYFVAGSNLWVAQPAAYDLIRGGGTQGGAVFGATGGWELGWVLTEERQLTIGGGGMEVDGYGLMPYGRVIHNSTGTALNKRLTGMVTNAYTDLAGYDDPTKESWFWGFVQDHTGTPNNPTPGTSRFVVAYIPPNTNPTSGVFQELVKVTPNGQVQIPGSLIAGDIGANTVSSYAPEPTAPEHLTRKDYVDAKVAAGGGGGGTGGPPTGPAGGDLSGYYPNPGIATGVIVNADVSGSAAIATSKIAGLDAALTAKAPLASPALTGTPTVPSAAPDTNTTQAASTAFVIGQAGTASPKMDGTVTVGTSNRFARQDHVHPTNTNLIPKSLLTAKGDVIAASGSATPVRVAAGTDGQALVADAASAAGVKWSTISSVGIPASTVDAKGDLIVGTADNTVGRLAIGANATVLTADSSAPGGMKWAESTGGAWSGTQRVAPVSYWWWATPGNADLDKMKAAVPYQEFLVCNPSSGVGEALNADWVARIAEVQAAGLKVYGYVQTDYAGRFVSDEHPLATPASIKAEVDKYYSWYNVDGIFYDESSWEAAYVPFYLDLYNYVKNKAGVRGRTVIINPGASGIDEGYMATCDIVMNFESYAPGYLTKNDWPAWIANYPHSRFWHAIHEVTSEAQAQEILAKTLVNRAGYVYLTTSTFNPNPWDKLAVEPYWAMQVDHVESTGTGGGGGGGGAPSGPAGGDLSGYYPNPTLAVDRVKKTGDTMTGNLQISTAAGTGALAVLQSGGLWRWTLGKNNTAESTGNAGSNFAIGRYSDAGAWIDDPLSINRVTGNVTVSKAPQGTMDVATKAYVDSRGISRSIIYISAATTLLGAAATDYVYVCAGAAAYTVTLPTALGNTNRYTIKRTATANVTVKAAGVETIDWFNTFVLEVQFQSIDLVSDGTNWVVI